MVKPARLIVLMLAVLAPSISQAQSGAACGVVNAIDYPIDIHDTLEDNYDDFARYRERFGELPE